jgi:hypothetical protein
MKPSVFLLIASLLLATAIARAQMPSDDLFPSHTDFPELHLKSDVLPEDAMSLLAPEENRLFEDVGFESYARQMYTFGDSGLLAIEIVSLKDFRAAYSLLTLLRNSNIQTGPPGDAFTMEADVIRFAKKKEWVRIHGSGIQQALLKRIALFVSNRLGEEEQSIPLLVTLLPKTGLDSSSLRYFPGLKSFKTYSGKSEKLPILKLNTDMEIVQARYSLENHTGTLSLLYFPTSPVAEECFEEFAFLQYAENISSTVYARRIGPIIALLDGNFDPRSSGRILGAIHHRYSISWLDEDKPIEWGVPVYILSTAIKSLFLVVLLCGVSMVAGAGYAIFRFILRGRTSRDPSDRKSEITQLRMR